MDCFGRTATPYYHRLTIKFHIHKISATDVNLYTELYNKKTILANRDR